MYRYVLRRLRDIVEKTYSVLDAQKTWTCNKNVENSGGGACSSSNNTIVVVRPVFSELCSSDQKNGELCFIPERRDAGGSTSGANKERCHKQRAHCDFTWISALTWSSALVCGWYASQLLCLHRRNLDSRCMYSRVFMNSGRAFHTSLLARLAFATPQFTARGTTDNNNLYTPQRHYHQHLQRRVDTPDSHKSEDSGVFDAKFGRSDSPQFIFEDHEELHDLHKYVINVSNDDDIYVKKEKPTPEKSSPSTVDQAVQNLLAVIGEIEFQLGVKSIGVGDYTTAVSHLKLATSHHHAAATFNLGICAENGLGMKKDMALAMNCYQAATDLGHPEAMFNLAIFYAQGLGGLKKSRKAARKLFETAALLGVQEAKLALGLAPVDILPGLTESVMNQNSVLVA